MEKCLKMYIFGMISCLQVVVFFKHWKNCKFQTFEVETASNGGFNYGNEALFIRARHDTRIQNKSLLLFNMKHPGTVDIISILFYK